MGLVSDKCLEEDHARLWDDSKTGTEATQFRLHFLQCCKLSYVLLHALMLTLYSGYHVCPSWSAGDDQY